MQLKVSHKKQNKRCSLRLSDVRKPSRCKLFYLCLTLRVHLLHDGDHVQEDDKVIKDGVPHDGDAKAERLGEGTSKIINNARDVEEDETLHENDSLSG